MLSVWQKYITDDAGNVIASPSIEVRRESDDGLEPLFSDVDGNSSLGNPFTGGSDGFARFYVAGGRYKITATGGGEIATFRDVQLGTAQGYDVETVAPVVATDGGTDAFQFSAPGGVEDGDVLTVTIPAANSTASPTLDNTGGLPTGARDIVTSAGSAYIGMLQPRVHRFEWRATPGEWIVLDPAPIDEDDMASDLADVPPSQQSVAAFVGCEKIESGSVSGASSLEITDLSADYSMYVLVITGIRPATDDQRLLLNVSTDNGSSFISGSGNYQGNQAGRSESASDNSWSTRGGISTIDLGLRAVGFGNASGEVSNLTVEIRAPMNSNAKTSVRSTADYFGPDGDAVISISNGVRTTAEANNAIQIAFAGGNIAEADYTLYGVR